MTTFETTYTVRKTGKAMVGKTDHRNAETAARFWAKIKDVIVISQKAI